MGGAAGFSKAENGPFLKPKNEIRTFLKPKPESGYLGENRKVTFLNSKKKRVYWKSKTEYGYLGENRKATLWNSEKRKTSL